MLTALAEAGNRIAGLEAGADDYLSKPFDPRELVLRINNILRRNAGGEGPKIEQVMFGPYTFSLARKELRKAAEVVRPHRPRAGHHDALCRRAGETIPRHELIGNDTDVGERTIDVQINRLRRKIEDDPANPVWLQTVRGIGYRLASTEPRADEDDTARWRRSTACGEKTALLPGLAPVVARLRPPAADAASTPARC